MENQKKKKENKNVRNFEWIISYGDTTRDQGDDDSKNSRKESGANCRRKI